MPSPFNPARRNRNIGTSKQGHTEDNHLTVPRAGEIAEQLGEHASLVRTVQGKDVTFIVEATNGGCVHACTVEDIVHVLAHVPLSDWAGLQTFVLRQSTRKTRILNRAWGRLFYWVDLAFRGRRVTRGPAIFMEAVDVRTPLKWSTGLDPEDSAELERLRADGHRIERHGRRHIVTPNAESSRATQLYRTLPHEIGHWFDWLERVEGPVARGEDFDALYDRYFTRPKSEREAFAHRYADKLRVLLEAKGVIPFSRIEP